MITMYLLFASLRSTQNFKLALEEFFVKAAKTNATLQLFFKKQTMR